MDRPKDDERRAGDRRQSIRSEETPEAREEPRKPRQRPADERPFDPSSRGDESGEVH
jgi:hypothetical protein